MKLKLLTAAIATALAIATFAQNMVDNLVHPEEDYQQEIIKVTNLLSNPDLLDSLVQKVYANSPGLKTFDEDMKLYDQEYLQKSRNWVSSFRFGVNVFNASTSVNEFNESTTTYGVLPSVGINLAVDPALILNRKSQMKQAENKKQRSYYQQLDQKQLMKAQLMNLYYEYLAMLEAVLIRQHALDARRQYAQIFEIEFKNGNRTLDELLTIQHQVYLAEEGLMQGHVQSMKKQKEIQILLGEF